MAAAVVTAGGRFLLVRRGPERRWAGMWSFPVTELAAGEDARAALVQHLREKLDLEVCPGDPAALIRHAVTRFRITLTAYECEITSGLPQPRGYAEWGWFDADQLARAGLPSPHRRLADLLLRNSRQETQLELSYPD